MRSGAANDKPALDKRTPVPTILRRRRVPRPTVVFDSYWKFAAARQAIFFKRIGGVPPPWTQDPILQDYKFTNAYRASDRTSQYLIRRVIYEGDQRPDEVFFRTILFKLFNRIETWEALSSTLGHLAAADFDPDAYAKALADMRARGDRLYSAAYIVPPVYGSGEAKHIGHLRLLDGMLQDRLCDQIVAASTLADVYGQLRKYPSLGPFLAFQFTIDLNYGPALAFDEQEFVVAGPGAREGIAKCFRDREEWSDEDLIHWTVERQDDEFERRDITFQSLWGRPLKPIDCQNLFCEIAKYSRVAHPRFTAPGGRSRIKQRFSSRGRLEGVWYPPKWGLEALAA